MIPYQPFLYALANRARGGLVYIPSGQLGRLLLWALPVVLSLFFTKHPDNYRDDGLYGGALIAALFAGVAIPAWGPYVHLKSLADWVDLTGCGLIMTGIVATVVYFFGYYNLSAFLMLSGLLMAPSYWAGNKIPSTLPQFETGVPLGELIFGFSIGLFVFLSTIL